MKYEPRLHPLSETEAKFIRLTYLDHHAQQAGNFPNTFAFTTEVEAYRVR